MTVAELIQHLECIKDKSKPVVHWYPIGSSLADVAGAIEVEGYVEIYEKPPTANEDPQ